MRIAITGANGLFGSGLDRTVRQRHHSIPLTRAQADVTDADQLMRVLAPLKLDVLIHAAAIADPDVCQTHPDQAYQVNVGATSNVVSAAEELGFAVVLISSDAVFDGQKNAPYLETDVAHPISVYGQTKLEAETAVKTLKQSWILRVSVLFGPGKINFVDKGLRKIANGETYVVAADQLGSATYTLDAAEKILEVVEAGRYGLYHLCNQGTCSRLELARHAAQLAELDPARVEGRTLEQMGRPAPRPKYAVMRMQALQNAGFNPPRPWTEALAEYLQNFWRKAQ
jgi:dTDP-4-dehydrorhamnose reductase